MHRYICIRRFVQIDQVLLSFLYSLLFVSLPSAPPMSQRKECGWIRKKEKRGGNSTRHTSFEKKAQPSPITPLPRGSAELSQARQRRRTDKKKTFMLTTSSYCSGIQPLSPLQRHQQSSFGAREDHCIMKRERETRKKE